MTYRIDGLKMLMIHQGLCQEAREIMRDKSAAYADVGDPFRNFMLAERSGLCSAELGVLVRMQDKFSRLNTFVNKGAEALGSEEYRDSILDLLNYLVLLHCLVLDKAEAAKEGVQDVP